MKASGVVQCRSCSTMVCCLFNEYAQAGIKFLFIVRFLIAVYVIREKKYTLAYFSDFFLQGES